MNEWINQRKHRSFIVTIAQKKTEQLVLMIFAKVKILTIENL